MSVKNKEESIAKRAEEWMKLLSEETPEVRDEIAKTFPAYNSLLGLHAKTFEEFALLPIARHKDLNYKDILFSYRSILPICPRCRNKENVKRRGQENYWCVDCNFKFKANHNSLSSGFKLPSVVWRKILHCMLESYSLKKTCDYCSISPNTYYNIRNRIFYAMKLMMEEVKLFGNIQCDNTFVYLSYKGTKLQNEEYPEDSPFGNLTLAPRSARKRGGENSYSTKNNNSVCIFAAIDEYGHSMVRVVGVGAASATKLFNSVGSTKYLYIVPEKEPFEFFASPKEQKDMRVGEPSLLIADCESAIKKYAAKININFESHIFRREGKQMKMEKGAHDIQRVNGLHARLKKYLQRLNYVSSKYLPGFLIMFEFIENTRASEEAVGRLFEILATPGLGESKEFFENLFVTPEFGETFEKRIKSGAPQSAPINEQKKIYAIYLYDLMLKGEAKALSLPYIAEITEHSVETILQLHEEAKKSGHLNTIYENIVETGGAFVNVGKKRNVPVDYLVYYDEYVEMRKRPPSEQTTFKDFVHQANSRYNKMYSEGNVRHHFKNIMLLGLRPPLPDQTKQKGLSDLPPKTQEKYLLLYRAVNEKYMACRQNNIKITKADIYRKIASEMGCSPETVRISFLKGQQLDKNNVK